MKKTKPSISPQGQDLFEIEGGRPLRGSIRASGNKNAALPILAASLLTSEEVILEDLPRIRDVEVMLAIMAEMGVELEWQGDNVLRIHARNVKLDKLPPDLAREVRTSFLFTAPLLHRQGYANMALPGGDGIG
ncbi:MAG: UDP-N-acetylglucosamine 1-carboxyvinyltransferase, partial [Lentisphaerae bacterium]